VDAVVHLFVSLYALTLGKKRIVAFFSAITVVQFIMEMFMIGISANKAGTWWIVLLLQAKVNHLLGRRHAANENAADTPPSLPPVHICQFSPHRNGIHVAFTFLW